MLPNSAIASNSEDIRLWADMTIYWQRVGRTFVRIRRMRLAPDAVAPWDNHMKLLFHGHTWLYNPTSSGMPIPTWERMRTQNVACPACETRNVRLAFVERYLLNVPLMLGPDNAVRLMLGQRVGTVCSREGLLPSRQALFLALVLTTVRTIFRSVHDWRMQGERHGNIYVCGVLYPPWSRKEWETGDFPAVTVMEFVGCQPRGADSLNVAGAGEILVLSDTSENPFEPVMVDTGCNVSQFAPLVTCRLLRTCKKTVHGVVPTARYVMFRADDGLGSRADAQSHAHKCWRTILHMEEMCSLPAVASRNGKKRDPCAQCGADRWAVVGGWKLYKCSKCLSAVYCGEECQRAHWESTHHRECKALTEAQWDSYSRLWARGGWSSRPSICATCGLLPANRKWCPCRRVAYCGTTCQRAHWRSHKPECAWKTTADNSQGTQPDL